MERNVLVTGGAGYLGSILVPELLRAGNHVTVVDNFMYHQNSLAHVCFHPRLKVCNLDVRNFEQMKPFYQKADVIIPLAALVGAPLCDKDRTGATTTNHDAPIRMFRSLSKEQFVLMPTTNSAYGTGDENNFCTEDSPLNPISLYARDKVAVEKELMEHENAISFRLATVFGMSPRMRIDLLVNDFTYRALNDRFIGLFEADFKRNYIHIRDVAGVFLFALERLDSLKGEIFNVGLSDANLSKRELCELIQQYVPKLVFSEAPIGKDPDQRNYIVSNEKIESKGFYPKVKLSEGIQELLKGYAMIKNSRYANF